MKTMDYLLVTDICNVRRNVDDISPVISTDVWSPAISNSKNSYLEI